jgi:UDP-N-acetylglucosamine--N-acetylmuramyl-(pentapeptide) pyrophosphoryl-undecaprenol N-acetylglucosamine transferase
MRAANATDFEMAFRFVIAGGGTGGHLFPGIAIARELERRFKEAEILFVVGRKRMESDLLKRHGYPAKAIDVEGLKGRGWKKGLIVMFKLPWSILQSVLIIKGFSPLLVLGMGGYSAGPICLAARLMGVPTAIHEQNSYPGLANRLLSRIVHRVFISFEESRAYFKAKSIILTGNPVRKELFSTLDVPFESGKAFTVLIVGGSQGAKAINEVFAEALAYLNAEGRNPRVIHQTGKADHARAVQDYRNRGLTAELHPFIANMTAAYREADLVVSRAGATTIFELAALGKPSVLIPYPYATNQHQEMNARSLVQAGGAEMIHQSELTPECLSKVLIAYMDNPSALKEMGRRARKTGRPDAAEFIVDHLVAMTS